MDIRNALIILHLIGTALGVGGATVSDYLFFKFTKTGILTKDGFATLKAVSNIVWIGLFILLISGFGFAYLYMSGYKNVHDIYSLDKMWAKLTIVCILVANGFVLHRVVLPLFEKRLGKPYATPAFIKKSPIVFSAGAVSAASWYATLILGGWRGLNASYTEIMLGYLVVVALGIAISNLLGRRLLKQSEIFASPQTAARVALPRESESPPIDTPT